MWSLLLLMDVSTYIPILILLFFKNQLLKKYNLLLSIMPTAYTVSVIIITTPSHSSVTLHLLL